MALTNESALSLLMPGVPSPPTVSSHNPANKTHRYLAFIQMPCTQRMLRTHRRPLAGSPRVTRRRNDRSRGSICSAESPRAWGSRRVDTQTVEVAGPRRAEVRSEPCLMSPAGQLRASRELIEVAALCKWESALKMQAIIISKMSPAYNLS